MFRYQSNQLITTSVLNQHYNRLIHQANCDNSDEQSSAQFSRSPSEARKQCRSGADVLRSFFFVRVKYRQPCERLLFAFHSIGNNLSWKGLVFNCFLCLDWSFRNCTHTSPHNWKSNNLLDSRVFRVCVCNAKLINPFIQSIHLHPLTPVNRTITCLCSQLASEMSLDYFKLGYALDPQAFAGNKFNRTYSSSFCARLYSFSSFGHPLRI